MAVREDTHDIGATTDLFVKPFLRVIGTDLSANARREGAEGQDVVGGVEDVSGRVTKAGGGQFVDDVAQLGRSGTATRLRSMKSPSSSSPAG